jgi:hypothetical protein
MTIVTKNIFLRGKPNQSYVLGFLDLLQSIEKHIEKHNYRSRLPAITRLHPEFHVNNLRPCSTTFFRHDVPATLPHRDNEAFDVSHISAVCIN